MTNEQQKHSATALLFTDAVDACLGYEAEGDDGQRADTTFLALLGAFKGASPSEFQALTGVSFVFAQTALSIVNEEASADLGYDAQEKVCDIFTSVGRICERRMEAKS